MKRPIIRLILALVLVSCAVLVGVVLALAAPANQEQRPTIAQPVPDAPARGVVQIIGSAVHPQFQRYELYYAPWPVPSDQSWIFIGDAHFSQQPLGLLGTWDSRSVPDGAYALRVRVVKLDGNYLDSDARRVVVVNTRLPDTPTPVPTDTPEEPPTSLPPTPTIVIQMPGEETPTPELSPTPALQATDLPPSPEATAGVGLDVTGSDLFTQLVNTDRLLDTARKAALYTVGAFAALGLFFGFKAILVWLWHKIRP